MEAVICLPTTVITKKSGVKCCDVKELGVSKCSCRVMLGLNEDLLEHVMEQKQNSNNCGGNLNEICNDMTLNDDLNVEYPELKKGINLPKSEWLTTNEYFKLALASYPSITSHDLNSLKQQLNDTIDNHFAQTLALWKAYRIIHSLTNMKITA